MQNKSTVELLRGNNANKILQLLQDLKLNFKCTLSNYTKTFEIDGYKQKFIKTKQPVEVFAAYARIKRDVKDKPLPIFDFENIKYYDYAFTQSIYHSSVGNIDLSSAYANILFRDKIIKRDTLHYLQRLTKAGRLAAVGMLAGKKTTYEFRKGEIFGEPIDISNVFAPFFYYCVQRTADVMDEIKKLLGSAYLFTWADGIYFKNVPPKKYEQIETYLKKMKLPYTYEELKEFKVDQDEYKYAISFQKGTDIKKFNLPKPQELQTLVKDIILNNTNNTNKKNETSKIKIPAKQGRRVRDVLV